MKNLFLLLLVSINFAFASQISKSDYDKVVNEAKKSIKQQIKRRVNSGKKKPAQNKESVFFLIDEFYRSGIVSVNQLNSFKSKFLNIKGKDSDGDRSNKKSDWIRSYNKFFDKQFDDFKKNRPVCLSKGKVAVGAQCCTDLYPLPNRVYQVENNSCGAKTGSQCSKHEDCCSKFCEGLAKSNSGTCSVVNTCYELVPNGQECSIDSPYCDQTEANENDSISCISIDHNGSNTNSCNAIGKSCSSNDDCCSDKCQSGKCEEKSICMTCSPEGQVEKPNKLCCPGLFKSTSGKCMRLMPIFSIPKFSYKKKSIFQKIIENISEIFFSKAHADIVCNGSTCEREGLDGVLSAEQEAEFEKEIAQQCLNKEGDEKESCLKSASQRRNNTINENIKENNSTGIISQKNFAKIFGVPAFTAKEKSDVQTCEFNSLNDNWLAASQTEKNAQIVLLGFEVMLSGVGTQDKINFDFNGKKSNLYSALKEMMVGVRANRISMYKKMSELDKEMTCLCMENLGVNTFGAEKVQAYRENCNQNVAELDGDKKQTETEKLTDIDKGVSGISQSKMILTWQNKRSQIQLELFDENTALEEKLEKLIKQYNEINWFEGPLKDHYAYKYEKSSLTLFSKILIGVAAGAAIYFSGGALLGVLALKGITATLAGYAVVVATGAGVFYAGDVVEALMENDKKVQVTDKCVTDEGILEDVKRCERFVFWTHYQDSNGEHSCDIKRRKMNCLTNMHYPTLDSQIADNVDAAEQFDSIKTAPLLDVWIPNFYNNTDATELTKNQNLIQKSNTAFNQALDKFKTDKKGKSINDMHEFMAEKLSEQMKFMTNSDGQINNRFKITQQRIDDLKKAFKTYALCGKFSECSGLIADEDKKDELLGFGNFIQTDVDAEMFANYVYQMHFFWPKVANTTFKAYPPAGMQAYLDGILYNLQLLGSLNMMKGLDYAELFNAFEGDLSARKGRYGAKGITAELGESSINSKFSKPLLKALKLIDFSTGEGIEAFDKIIGKEKAANNLSQADLGVAASARSHAASLRNRVEQNKAIETALLKTSRGKKQIARLQNFAERFSSPADKMFSNIKSAKQFNSALIKSSNINSKNVTSSFKAPKFESLNIRPSRSNNYNNYSSRGGTKSSAPAHGLSDSELETMIKTGKEDKALYEVDPKDTIFNVVSKCYKRNLDLVLVSSKEIEEAKSEEKKTKIKKESSISDKKKEELKSLLGK